MNDEINILLNRLNLYTWAINPYGEPGLPMNYKEELRNIVLNWLKENELIDD